MPRLQTNNRTDKIEAAGLRVLDRCGVAGLSLAAVARALGVTTPAMYRHVPDRAGLVQRVFRAGHDIFRTTITAALDAPDEAARLWALVRIYREFAERHPGIYELLFVAPHGLSGHVYPEGFREAPADTFTFMVDRVAGAMRERAMPDADAVDTALLLWAQLHGLVMLRRSGRFRDRDPEYVRFYEESVARVLAAPPPRDVPVPGPA